jgi:hypothetical protein
MFLIGLINIALVVTLTLAKPLYVSRSLGLDYLNPITIISFFQVPILLMQILGGPAFLFDEGISDVWFNFALGMQALYLSIELVVIVLFLNILKKSPNISKIICNFTIPHFNLKRGRMIIVSFILYFLAFLFLILVAQHSFGLLNWIKDPRAGYILGRSGAGQYYAFSILFLTVGYVTGTVFCKSKFSLFLFFFVSQIFGWFTASKGIILAFAVYFLIIIKIKEPKYFNRLVFLITPVLLIIVLNAFGSFDPQDVLKYFDYYVNSAMYYRAYFSGVLPLFFGNIFLTDFWAYLPRSLFPEKPYVYGTLLLNDYFFPGDAELGHTPAFGGPVGAFADFGFIGVIFSALFCGSQLAWVFANYILFYKNNTLTNNSRIFVCFLFNFAPVFFIYFQPVWSLIIFFILVYGIKFLNSVVIVKSNN